MLCRYFVVQSDKPVGPAPPAPIAFGLAPTSPQDNNNDVTRKAELAQVQRSLLSTAG